MTAQQELLRAKMQEFDALLLEQHPPDTYKNRKADMFIALP